MKIEINIFEKSEKQGNQDLLASIRLVYRHVDEPAEAIHVKEITFYLDDKFIPVKPYKIEHEMVKTTPPSHKTLFNGGISYEELREIIGPGTLSCIQSMVRNP